MEVSFSLICLKEWWKATFELSIIRKACWAAPLGIIYPTNYVSSSSACRIHWKLWDFRSSVGQRTGLWTHWRGTFEITYVSRMFLCSNYWWEELAYRKSSHLSKAVNQKHWRGWEKQSRTRYHLVLFRLQMFGTRYRKYVSNFYDVIYVKYFVWNFLCLKVQVFLDYSFSPFLSDNSYTLTESVEERWTFSLSYPAWLANQAVVKHSSSHLFLFSPFFALVIP